jgi:hypothetical protein
MLIALWPRPEGAPEFRRPAGAECVIVFASGGFTTG